MLKNKNIYLIFPTLILFYFSLKKMENLLNIDDNMLILDLEIPKKWYE